MTEPREPPPRRPFDIVRACFLLLAVVVCIAMGETMVAVVGCVWNYVARSDLPQPDGACGNLGNNVREIMTELLTAILALIAASRPLPPKE